MTTNQDRRPLRERVEALTAEVNMSLASCAAHTFSGPLASLTENIRQDRIQHATASLDALAAALLVAVEALERIAAFNNPATTAPDIAADALRRMEEC